MPFKLEWDRRQIIKTLKIENWNHNNDCHHCATFFISIIYPNVNGFTLAKVKRKKVEDEEVPFQKPAAPEQQDDDEEEVETRPWKLVTETAV